MCLLIETIKISENKIFNLNYHQERVNRSFADVFHKHNAPVLAEIIKIPAAYSSGLVKCRITYGADGIITEYEKYVPRKINTLKIIQDDNILYNHKYADRNIIKKLYALRGNCDDILIVKNNMITDTSICNILFKEGNKWITPSTPLLKGTMRSKLIDSGFATEEKISVKDLVLFQEAMLVNAMIGAEINNIIPVKNIL